MKRNAVAWAALVVSVAALVGSRNYTRALPAAQEIPAAGQQVARDLSAAFNAVAEFIKPSVVQINVEKKGQPFRLRGGNPGGRGGNGIPKDVDPKEMEEMLRRFFGPGREPNLEKQGFERLAEGTGSGFVYDDKGHILTNNHVVEGAEKITVTFWDGVEVAAKVVGTHPETDVAVIKVENTDYRPVLRGNSKNLKVGEWVLAVGSPFGLSQTVTAGIVSATGRENVGINDYESFIQTDTSINPGNSGGPLVDTAGRVVGINSAIATMTRSNAGVGFTIPIDMAARLADKIIRDGKITPRLMGIKIAPLTPKVAKQLGLEAKTKGVVVTDVVKGAPAEKAGLKEGDIITAFDGSPVTTPQSLQYLVSTSDADHPYDLKYLRGGKDQVAKVTTSEAAQVARAFDEGRPARRPRVEAPKPEFNDFGLAVEPLTADLAKKYNWNDSDDGLVVTAVKDGGPAATAGVEVGDRITKVVKDKQIQPVKSLDDFQSVAGKADEVSVFVEDVNKKLPGQFMTLTKAGNGK